MAAIFSSVKPDAYTIKVSSAALIFLMSLRSMAMTKRMKRIKKLGEISHDTQLRGSGGPLQVFED